MAALNEMQIRIVDVSTRTTDGADLLRSRAFGLSQNVGHDPPVAAVEQGQFRAVAGVDEPLGV